MRLADIDRLQAGIWRRHGETVALLDAAHVITWTGTAVEESPDSVEAPGSELSYEEAVRRLLFRRTDQPSLPRGSLLRWRGAIWRVDETARRDDHALAVTVYADPTPVTRSRPWSDHWSDAWGPDA